MHAVRIEPEFPAWRERARELLSAAIPPDQLLWEDGSTGAGSLFGGPAPAAESARVVRIPKDFISLAELVACHRDPARWDVLYHVAYRITHGGERHLLRLRTDDAVRRLEDWASAVRRDRHKMTAFVRFRKVGEATAADGLAREQFAAWFEPDHDIVKLTAPFFAKRFASMDWSILTPSRCAHWDGTKLQFTSGVTRREAPRDDELEDYWRSYYGNIFNPARLKLKAMRSEMPVKYWKNLPEAPLIAELTSGASARATRMVDAPDSARAHVSERIPSGIPERAPAMEGIDPSAILASSDSLTIREIATAAGQCRACSLCDRATQTVFGAGPEDAEIMIIGEQPGDCEDIAGKPFVGPSGALLDRALEEIGLEREAIYLTNTVKHFKWKRRGKIRLHQTPSAGEVERCRPWVLAEILKVRPRALVLLGSTAARALLQRDFSMTEERGIVRDSQLAEKVIATFHPSYLLRSENRGAHTAWLADLKLATT
ncbi:MAG: UdgX family uracil-DNA binding protein [Verrucomicrobiales bacterium]